MGPPSVFDRFGRISTFPFTRQNSNGVWNRAPAVDDNDISGLQSVGPQTAAPGTAEILQCFREACGRLFSDDASWREHNRRCHIQSPRYQCVFTKCTESFASDSPDTFIRHQKMHRMWVCKKIGCFSQFDKRDKALKHATKDHIFESPGDWVKETWITTSLRRKKETRSQHGVDLELTNLLEELEAKALSKVNTDFVLDDEHSPGFGGFGTNEHGTHVTLPTAVFACVANQLNILNGLLDHHSLIPTASESQKLQQALDMLQEKLRIGERHRTAPDGWNGNFDFSSSTPSRGRISVGSPEINGQRSSSRIAHPRPQHLSPPLPSDISTSHEAVQNQLPYIGSQSAADSDEDLEDTQENSTTDEEPRQAMSLEKSEQLRYFEAMQKCCIEAAFTFYLRHKPHLDTINDKNSKPLCQTAKKGPIENPTDLSLPHWTHLLRRISDARGLQKEMVSRIGSFNGDISPVDELQHAFKKEKVKSDRDLLALIQLTRNFCWQLKDWDRCKDLDDLYSLVDKEIRQVKRNDSQASRKRRPKLLRGGETSEISGFRAPHRQSATWPRTIPDTEDEFL